MFIYFLLPILAIALSILVACKTAKNHGAKRGFLAHFVSLVVIFSLCFAMATMVSAEEDGVMPIAEEPAVTKTAETTESDTVAETTVAETTVAETTVVPETETETEEETAPAEVNGLGLIAAALAIGLAGIGGGIAVAAGAPAAIGATAENPEVFGKAIIFVVLGEAIALYGFVISFLIINKV